MICNRCSGLGYVQTLQLEPYDRATCPDCKGSGRRKRIVETHLDFDRNFKDELAEWARSMENA